MLPNMPGVKIVKQGLCLYDERLEYRLLIVESATLYGTGSDKDPPELAEDSQMDCWYVLFEDLMKKGRFITCGDFYFSFEEAVDAAQRLMPHPIKWTT